MVGMNYNNKISRLAIALSALVSFNMAIAADSPEYGPIPDWVKSTATPATSAAPDSAPVKILLDDQQFNFLPKSQQVFQETMIRVQTAQGLQAVSTLQLPWQPDTDVLTIHKVHIIRGDQVIDALAAGQKFTLLRRENNLEYSALDGILTAAFQPADIRVGDILDLAYSITRTDPVLEGATQQLAGGWVQAPYARVHMRARWPQSTTVRWRLTDNLPGLKEQKDGNFTTLEYTADNIEPPVQPTGAPLRFAVMRAVEFSGFKSWPEVSRRVAPLFVAASTLAPDSPLRAEAVRIKTVSHSPLELASAALSLVEDNVRYVYLGMDQGSIVPASADLTWTRRFGDCKAKTVLLIALLRELGIDAEPVAVSTKIGDGLDARLPMIALFDHVIVRAHIGGEVYWLDGTRSADRHVALLKTPNYRWGLPLVAAGSELVRVEAAPLTVPSQDTHIRIDATAGITDPAPMHVETVLSGDAAISTKLALASLTGDALDRGLRNYWSKTYDFVDIKSVSNKFDEDAGTETLTMDGSARMSWKDQWYETDGLGVGFEAQYTRDAGANLQAPYSVQFPIYVRTSETILLPKGATPFTTSGNPVDRVVAGVEYKRSFSLVDGTFTAEASTRSIEQDFPAAEAPDAQAALRAMAKDGLYLRSPNPGQQYLDEANKLMGAGQYANAIADFDKVVAVDPKNAYALADRGLSYLWINDSAKAIQDWNAADAIDPNNEVTPRGRGVLAFRAGNYTEAISDFTQSLQRKPDDTFTLKWRASAYMSANRYVEAIADTNELVKLLPQDPDAYTRRAVAQVRAGQTEAALADARALIASSATLQNYALAANIYTVAGKYPEAVQTISHMIDIAPNERLYLMRAGLRPKSDQLGRRGDIDAALKLNPRSPQALAAKISNDYINGRYTDAIATATLLMEIDGAKSEYLLVRGLALAKNSQSSLSEQDLKQARAAATTQNMLNDYCWKLATANIDLQEALSACEEAVAKGPGDAASLDSKAFVLLRLGRYSESIATYDAALALSPNLTDSLYGRGLAKLRAGDAGGSSRDIAAALAADNGIADQFADYGLKP